MEKPATIYGIECFHPFQSNAMLDFGLALPERWRIRGSHAKPIFRELARERLGSNLKHVLARATGAFPATGDLVSGLISSGRNSREVSAQTTV